MSASLAEFANAVHQVRDSAGELLLTATVAGATSMALIQMIKEFLNMRRWFNRPQVRRWLRSGVRSSAESHKRWGLTKESFSLRDEAESQLIKLATAGDQHALYSLPIEQLCGQVSAAAQAALSKPAAYAALIAAVGSSADSADLDILFSARPIEESHEPPEKGGNAERTTSAPQKTSQAASAEAMNSQVSEFAEARNRVSHQMQRAIDSLQIATGMKWKRWLQLSALGLSFILAFALTLGTSLNSGPLGVRFWIVGILGGFLAPVMRDLLAALQVLRVRR